MIPTQTTIGTSRRKSPDLRTEHRNRLATAVRRIRARGIKFVLTQDYRTAKNFAGTEHTCDAYLDRVEASAGVVEDILLKGEDIAL